MALTGCSAGSDGAAIDLTFDVCQPIAVAPGADVDAGRLASIDHALAMWNALGAAELSRASGDGAGAGAASGAAAGAASGAGAGAASGAGAGAASGGAASEADPSSGDGTEPQVISLEFQAAAEMFHGFYDDQRGVVYINLSLEDDHQRSVTIAHELGHAFGLVHVQASERASVMNPGNLTVEPTAADAAALTALWGNCPVPRPRAERDRAHATPAPRPPR